MSRLLLFGLILMIGTASVAQAQLSGTIWAEGLEIFADDQLDGGSGTDNAAPEPFQASLSGSNYSISGEVSFGPAGAPQTTCTVATNYTSGSIIQLAGSAFSTIIFKWVVRQTASGGPSVTTVPVNVVASGTVEVSADGGSFAGAGSRFILRYESGGEALVFQEINANNGGGTTPLSDSFAVTDQFAVAPDVVLTCDMMASAASSAFFNQGATSGTATGFVDPIIEVADELIPGTTENYRDYYEIEFSPGYYALGDPTPVKPSTWGQIKRLYSGN